MFDPKFEIGMVQLRITISLLFVCLLLIGSMPLHAQQKGQWVPGQFGLNADMKKGELTAKQIGSVSCPTCGAAVGEGCELNSGAPRSEPHVDRKFAALEAIEKKSV